MKTKYWLIIVFVLIALLLMQNACNKLTSDKLVKDISSYSDSAKFYKLKSGALIFTNTTLQLQSQEQIKALSSSINKTVEEMVKKFKSVNNVTYVTNNFTAGGDTVKSVANIPCDFDPYKVGHKDSSYTFVGTVSKHFFSIDTLLVPNNITLVQGRKKVGFMKYDNGININNSNPLMVSTNIKSYQYSPQKKWFEKTWFHLTAGALIGTGINTAKNIYFKKL